MKIALPASGILPLGAKRSWAAGREVNLDTYRQSATHRHLIFTKPDAAHRSDFSATVTANSNCSVQVHYYINRTKAERVTRQISYAAFVALAN